MDRKKELIRQYKETPRPMGIFQIKNKLNGKVLIGSSTDLPSILRRHRFQLELNGHRDNSLQNDWNTCGPDAFEFDILETIKTEEIPQTEWRSKISALEKKYLSEIEPYDDRGYNKRPRPPL